VIWLRVLIGLGGAAFLGLTGFFGWLTATGWHRPGWDDRDSRAYLVSRTATTAVVAAGLIVAAAMDAKEAALASSVGIIVGTVVSTMLARRLRRTET
jgi:hypothetical protein